MKHSQRFTGPNKPFYGTLTKPNRSFSLLGYIQQFLHVDRLTKGVTAGMVVANSHKEQFILAEHHTYADTQVFNAIRVTGVASVVEYDVVIHPVTQLETARTPRPAVTLPVARVPLGDASDGQFRVTKDSYIFAQSLSSSAMVDGKKVTTVTPVLGVYVAEVG